MATIVLGFMINKRGHYKRVKVRKTTTEAVLRILRPNLWKCIKGGWGVKRDVKKCNFIAPPHVNPQKDGNNAILSSHNQ